MICKYINILYFILWKFLSIYFKMGPLKKIINTKKSNISVRLLSGWQDSNLRPPAPKAGAITELRYTP